MNRYFIFRIISELQTEDIMVEDILEVRKPEFCCTIDANAASIASNIKIVGKMEIGEELTVSHTYFEAHNDKFGFYTYHWYRADNAEGENLESIEGAYKLSYTLTEKDLGRYIIFKLTPIQIAGICYGKEITISSSTVVEKNVSKYNTQIKSCPNIRRAYAKRLANLIMNSFQGDTINATKEEQYYVVSTGYIFKDSAIKAYSALKSKKYINNHYSY